ncbi:hypothetical protein DDE05_24995 [Streptomyces cavourensis]|nr:hypothetical protein DDE05_24995 [Streptomyces cavourensis]
MQENLSMSLATASRLDSPAMDAWKRDIIAAGPKQFGHEGMMAKPYGFQIMSNLMVKGRFDSGFLDDYGTAVRTFETSKGRQFNPPQSGGTRVSRPSSTTRGRAEQPGATP